MTPKRKPIDPEKEKRRIKLFTIMDKFIPMSAIPVNPSEIISNTDRRKEEYGDEVIAIIERPVHF